MKPDERITQAKQMYFDGFKLVEISKKLSLPEGTVRRWKSTHKWENERSSKKETLVRRKKGGQPGNKNATGPPGNRNHEKHGFFTKWLPTETMAILNNIKNDDPLDLLWDNIQLQYASIVRAQKLMHVADRDDRTVTKIASTRGDTSSSDTWEVQQAWDKQANFMRAQSRAMKTLESMITKYEKLLSISNGIANEEHQARLALLRAQTTKLETDTNPPIDDGLLDKMDTIDDIRSQMRAPEEDEL